MTRSLTLRAAIVSIALFAVFIATWHLATRGTGTVAQMDPDDSGQLESGELSAIAWLVSRHVPEALRTQPAPAEPAPEGSGPPLPAEPRALVPTHFARLDPGHDGFIDETDLRALQSPSRLDLRFRALLSAMDKDGDGRLSEAEFQASMGKSPR